MKVPFHNISWVTGGPGMGLQDGTIPVSTFGLCSSDRMPKTLEVEFPGREFPKVYHFKRSNYMLGYTTDWVYLTPDGQDVLIVENNLN